MIDWLTAAVTWLCFGAGALVLVLGVAGRRPSDLSVGLVGVAMLGVIAIGAVAVWSAAVGDGARGDAIEWIGYWASCLLVGIGTGFAALIQRDRWGTLVLAVGLLTVGVMVVRLDQVWFATGWA